MQFARARRTAMFAAALAMMASSPTWAERVRVRIEGIDEPMLAAITSELEINQYAARSVSPAQIRRLHARAPEQLRRALEPYGYYAAEVDSELTQDPKTWQVTYRVHPGEPVRVTRVSLQLEGPARELRDVRRAVRAFGLKPGDRFDHATYEAGKAAIQSALLSNGFFDAEARVHRVALSRAARSAEIDLRWEPGVRYAMGEARFEGSQFRPGFLQRYVPWRAGDPYSQERLLTLQRRLSETEFFAVVDVIPDIDAAADGVVPLRVLLVPAKRDVYSGGVFFGTDTGAGVRGGFQRRWLNDRGHSLQIGTSLAQRLSTLQALYRVPLAGADQRVNNFGLNLRDEDTVSTQSRTIGLVAAQSREWRGWNATGGLHVLGGDFTVAGRKDRSTLVYPEISFSRKQADDVAFVRRGYALTVVGRVAANAALSDTDLVQVRADGQWIHGWGRRQRVVARATVGTSWVSDFEQLPPELRFFAGGDRSIRGYPFQGVGPRVPFDPNAPLSAESRILGGEHLVAAGVDYEYYFTRRWGAAVFVDAGDAFSGSDFTLRKSVGVGVRWRSPVGMVRFDVGHALGDSEASAFEIHLTIGPDL